MSLSPGDIPRIHALFGRADELVARRRAIYGLALEFATELQLSDTVPTQVLDNPATRAHLAEVLGGTAEYDAGRVYSVEELARTVALGAEPGAVLRVASAERAERALGGALQRVGVDPGSSTDAEGPALVLAGSSRFATVSRTLLDGVELALELEPELVGDLLPHVALMAVVRAESAGQLGSASVREYPGLILLPEPQCAMEVAEALVHEGAHQKFFDLAVTRSIFLDPGAVRFLPPWSPDGTSPWPFEQCLAAYHAYCCLASFATAADGHVLHPQSLLPYAAERAGILAGWLHERGSSLGRDGQLLVGKLSGRAFEMPPMATDDPEVHSTLGLSLSPHPVARRHCGDWTLVMQWTKPVSLVWTPTRSLPESPSGSGARRPRSAT